MAIRMNHRDTFDQIFILLKQALIHHNRPIVTRQKKEKIAHSPFITLISCLLSLRTKDEITEQASHRLLTQHDTPEKIIQLTEKEIQKLIYPVGFYRVKAKRIRELSQILIDHYNGQVPECFSELLKLKGVGRKTANIVMVYGHHKADFLPIDTHCHRIPNRLGWVNTKTPEQTEQALKKILPKKHWNNFNHLFILFGQSICRPVSPLCTECPIELYCQKVGVTTHR